MVSYLHWPCLTVAHLESRPNNSISTAIAALAGAARGMCAVSTYYPFTISWGMPLEEEINLSSNCSIGGRHWRLHRPCPVARRSHPPSLPTIRALSAPLHGLQFRKVFILCVAAFSVFLRFCLARDCNLFIARIFYLTPLSCDFPFTKGLRFSTFLFHFCVIYLAFEQGFGSVFIFYGSGSGSRWSGWRPIRIRIQSGSRALMTKNWKKNMVTAEKKK